MKTIERVRSFIREEKPYAFLFLIIMLTFIAARLFTLSETKIMRPVASEALMQLKEAETRIATEMKDPARVQDFLKEHPSIALLMSVMSLIAAGFFIVGFILITGLVFRPDLRKKIYNQSRQEDETDWKFAMLFKVILLFIAASIGLSLLLSVINHYVLTGFSPNFFVLFETTLIDILCLFFMVKIIQSHGGKGWHDLGFNIPSHGFFKEVGVGIAAYFCVFPVFLLILVFLVMLMRFTGYEPQPHPLVNIFLEEGEKSTFLIYYSVFLATAIAPFLEEVFFRAFCFPILRKEWGRWFGMIATSVLFAAIHRNLFAVLPIFTLGMGLCYLYDKRRSLIAPVTLHLIHNTLFISYFFIVKKILSAV